MPFNRQSGLGVFLLAAVACGNGPAVDQNLTMYACGQQWIDVGADQDRAVVLVGADKFEMRAVPSASGARYVIGNESAPEAEFWERGGEARLTIGSEDYPACQRSDLLYASYLPIEAQADDGSWSMLLNLGSGIYRSQDEETVFEIAAVERHREAWIIETDGDLSVSVRRRGCDKNGSLSVTITDVDGIIVACSGGTGMTTLEGTYKAMLNGSEVSLTFMNEQRVGAYAGCNRMSGNYTRTGDTLNVGGLIATRMACMGSVMETEQRFVEFLKEPLTIEPLATNDDGFMLTSGENQLSFRPGQNED